MNKEVKSTGLIDDPRLSEEQRQQVILKLWELLQWQAEKYSGFDSTSMPVELAESLLKSLVFTLSIAEQESAASSEAFWRGDLKAALKRAQNRLEMQREWLQEEWSRVCLDAPPLSNVYYVDSMKNIGIFCQQYDVYYAAHCIPCSLDYPLLDPISEEEKGVCYVTAYLRRIAFENRFFNSFPPDAVAALLRLAVSDLHEAYMNFCAPILVNALGRMLLTLSPDALTLTPPELSRLQDLFFGKTKEDIFQLLCSAARSLCTALSLHAETSAYFLPELQSLANRIAVAAQSEQLGNVFVVQEAS